VKSSLPETIRDSALESGGNEPNIISLTQWSHKELNVAPYPEDRIFKNVARRVCEYAEEPSEVELVVEGKPNPVDGSKKAEVYDCSGLKTGEHETLNIE